MRKTKTVTVTAEGRDKGKTFVLTEMPARQAEAWADRAFLALAHSGINLPSGIDRRSGMAGIAEIAALVGGMQFSDLSPLMGELLKCVKVVSDPRHPEFQRELVDIGAEGDDIEEVATRQFLRQEVLALHTNFSLAAVILSLIAAASELKTIPATSRPSTSRRSSRA